MFGEKAALLLFLCLYITPLVNGTGAGEWFDVRRAAVEADDRLLSTAHCLQRVSHMQPALCSFRASIIQAVVSANSLHPRTGSTSSRIVCGSKGRVSGTGAQDDLELAIHIRNDRNSANLYRSLVATS